MITGKVLYPQVHNAVVVVSGSFLRVCVTTLSASIVLDTHVGFQVPFQGTRISKFTTTKLTRLFCHFKLLLFLLCKGALVDLVSQDVSL